MATNFSRGSDFDSESIVLFDVDGTLTPPRQTATEDMLTLLQELRKRVTVGIVGGSNFEKIAEQLGSAIATDYDFVFAENGTICYHTGKMTHKNSFENFLGKDRYDEMIKFFYDYIASIDIPVKTDEFVEVRTGMVNVSPIGRKCTQQQRDEFYEYDKQHNIRKAMVEVMQKKFDGWGLKFSIGGQISIDIFPIGWDKTFCLRYLDKFKKIYFFGDKTEPGGNDYEIFTSPLVQGTKVRDPTDTAKYLNEWFLNNKS